MNYVIGIDHGNGNMKTENVVFPCGFSAQEIKPDPLFAGNVVEYKGKFYTLSDNKFSYQTDKTTNENAFILTLFAIAKELIARAALGKPNYNEQRDFTGFVGKDVVLSVGLPPAHFDKQAKPFKEYFLKRAEHGISFKYNDKPFNFYIKDVIVLPQDYAAAIVFKNDLINEESDCFCIDIGDGTTDMVGLTNGKPVKETVLSREFGISKLRSTIIEDINNDYGLPLPNRHIDNFLAGKDIRLPEDKKEAIIERMKKITSDFTNELVNMLRSKVDTFKLYPVIFSGGGSIALKPYLEATGEFLFSYYIDDVKANAIAYQQIAKMQLGID